MSLKITSLSSGSHGNAYVVSNSLEGDRLLIEAGLAPKKLKKAFWEKNIMFKDILTCLISHEHKDHSASAEYLSNAGVNILAPESLEGIREDRLVPIKANKVYEAGSYLVKPVNMSHDDITCYGFFIYYKPTGDRLFYATDSMYVEQRPKKANYLMIEVNYQAKYLEEAIKAGEMDRANMRRVMRTHMGLETVLEFLKKIDTEDLKEIWILHVSKRNANPDEIKEAIQKEAGVPVYIA